jgi:small-conductance mechanosensitive channel/CRP-like cAMP-binding protein
MRSPAGLALRKLAAPLFVATVTGCIFLFAGDTYQAFGLAALDRSRAIIAYVLGISLFLSFGMLLDRLVRHVVLDGLVARALGSPVPGLLKQFAAIIIYLITGGAILAVVFKQDLTVLWAASGVAGIVLGLALQAVLQDVFSGLALNIDRPIRLGDSVQIDGAGSTLIEGEVKEISWRTTHILDTFNNVVVLPNSKLASATITNLSARKTYVDAWDDVVLDAAVPHERAHLLLTGAAVEACTEYTNQGQPEPYVLLWSVAPQGATYRVFYHCTLSQRDDGRSRVLQCCLRHLRQVGLRPAVPLLERPRRSDMAVEGPSWSVAELQRVLAGGAAFRGLPPDGIALLARQVQIRTLEADRELVQAGEVGNCAYVLLEGLIAGLPRRPRPGQAPTLFSSGSCLGCEAVLVGEAHAATLRTRTAVVLGEISATAFSALLATQNDAAGVLSRNLAQLMTDATAAANGKPSAHIDSLAVDLAQAIARNYAGALRRVTAT